jgi:hypothetical protein
MIRIGQRATVAIATTLLLVIAAPTRADESRTDPARLTPIPGTHLSQITLTDQAAVRLGIQAAELTRMPSGRLIIPYSSLLYDVSGSAWVYTISQPLTYVRQMVVVDSIEGEKAVLRDGPPPGTQIVTVGVPELYGIEKGVGE